MATFKAEVQNRRADGTYNVRIRITHNREVRRLSTNLYVTEADLTRGKKIKNRSVIDRCMEIIGKCREACNGIEYPETDMPVDELADRIKRYLRDGDKFRLDFIGYARDKAAQMGAGSGRNCLSAINALCRYIHCDSLDISEINTSFLNGLQGFIEAEPSMRGSNRQGERNDVPQKGRRAASLYLGVVRAVHNLAKREYNDEDRGIIRIPYSPFKHFKLKPQPLTRKRALPVEAIQAIIDLPYEGDRVGGKWNRFNVAKDCFLLSFALIGMNSADMFNAGAPANGVVVYNRTKTGTRRADRAEMRVKMEECIAGLADKYRDPDGGRLFNFYRHYADFQGFNKAINKGLKQIGDVLKIDDLEFYAARHSWATIARSSAAGIDKATVHEALNHVDAGMSVTDIYIDRDWSVIWKANERVLGLFDWTALSMPERR